MSNCQQLFYEFGLYLQIVFHEILKKIPIFTEYKCNVQWLHVAIGLSNLRWCV